MRYLVTLKGRFNKTHFVTGHVSPTTQHHSVYVSDCGITWKKGSKTWLEATRVRAPATGKVKEGFIWPHPYPGVTCEHCLRLGHQPSFWWRKNGQSPKKGDTGSLEQEHRDDR